MRRARRALRAACRAASRALVENGHATRADLDRLAQIFGRDSTYVEIQNAGLEEQQRVNPGLLALAEEAGLPPRRHGRRPLPRRVRRLRPRGASLHPVGRHAQEPGPLALRHERVLLQDAGGDGLDFPGLEHALARTRGRGALQRRARAGRVLLPTFPVPEGRTRSTTSSSCARGARPALREGDARADRAPPVRAEDDPRDGLRGLLPHRLGLHPLREAERRQRRPGPRLGGRLARRVLPRDHRRRPDPLRPPLRAVPQPGAEGPAGHGHRLLGRRARPRHQLRRREVRARPRRPDHHVLDDGRARRDPRRGPRARRPVRRRRPDRQLVPEGPGTDARGSLSRAPSSGRRSTRTRWRRRSSSSRRRSGAHAGGLDPRGRASSSARSP